MTPQSAGFVREPRFDKFCCVASEVWRTPEDVLLAIPIGCQEIEITEIKTVRGVVPVVSKPNGVFSIWPIYKKKEEPK